MSPRNHSTNGPGEIGNASAKRLLLALRAELGRRGDAEAAAGVRAYMKSAMPFHGVRVPEMRRVSRQLFSDLTFRSAHVWESTIWFLWSHARFREEWYSTIALARSRASAPFQRPAALRIYGRMIVSGGWWDTVDEIAVHCVGPIFRLYPAKSRPVLRAWATSTNLWRRRSAIICQVGSKGQTDASLLEACIHESIGSREFFLRKAIGWALREYSKSDPKWVRGFVAANEDDLSPLSRREAVRHLELS